MAALQIQLSPRAEAALAARETPLQVVLELYFSCLIRKRVLFSERALPGGIALPSDRENLIITFQPVASEVCTVADNPAGPPLQEFPVKSPEKFIPHWLRLHIKNGLWQGEFGYD